MKREEQLKNEIAKNYFAAFDTTKIIGNIDFAVAVKNENIEEAEFLFWAEAKKGDANIENSITQLVLTIGKAKTNEKHPTKFIGCFDEKKIAFVEYHNVDEFFSMHDFNWNVAPSNYHTKEFSIVLGKLKNALQEKEAYIFDFATQEAELKNFIKNNFNRKNKTNKRQIDKNNFTHVYYKWLEKVKPTIQISNWEELKKSDLLDSDFYLADLLSKNNVSIREKLKILLKNDIYKLATGKRILREGFIEYKEIGFSDKQKAYKEFWNIYQRPPKKEYWNFIIERRDLLVPQNFREIKGSFFTPKIWVEKSQEYIKNYLGENWQNEYYIWDCACGTGNLLHGLTNKYNLFASDIEQANISVLQTLIKSGERANLLENHCFQFDFLNDSFEKLPKDKKEIQNFFDTLPKKLEEPIKEIINIDTETASPKKLQKNIEKIKKFVNTSDFDTNAQETIHNVFKELPEELPTFFRDLLKNNFDKLPDKLHEIIKNEPHKLVIFINPPYAESGNKREIYNEKEEQKSGVSFTKTRRNYKDLMGSANKELYCQFLFRIYKEIPNCKIANFSTLKNLQGSNFKKFRANFRAKLKSLFLMPAYTFDNVKGKFPIGFFVWDAIEKEIFTKIKADVFEVKMKQVKSQELKEFEIIKKSTKNIHSCDNVEKITAWTSEYKDVDEKQMYLGNIRTAVTDFQNNNLCHIQSEISSRSDHLTITPRNLLVFCIYFSVRKVLPATWLNDRDQFLSPNKKWKDDAEFQNDCLAYTLFHPSNNVKSEEGENHWIPFREPEVDAQENFKSNFIADFIAGKIKNTEKQNGFKGMEKECFIPKEKLVFSKEAKAVFEAGKALFQYYHSQNDVNINASFYDIRGYFQKFKPLANGKKRMHAKSKDVKYNELLEILKTKLQLLGNKIAPKIYEYGFLKD